MATAVCEPKATKVSHICLASVSQAAKARKLLKLLHLSVYFPSVSRFLQKF